MKRILASAGLAALGLGAFGPGIAQAGSPGAPMTEPMVAAPPTMAAPAPRVRDWTGFYAGGRLGWGETGSGASGSGAIGGFHLGYLQDFGGFAAGVEGGYDAARIQTGLGGRINQVGRLGLRGGVTTGDLFVYATAGATRARVQNIGSDNGWYGGIGVEVALNDQWRVGGEVLHHRFSDFNNTGVNVNANTLQARVSFRF